MLDFGSTQNDGNQPALLTVTVKIPPDPIPAIPLAIRIVVMLGAMAHSSVPTASHKQVQLVSPIPESSPDDGRTEEQG